MSRFNADNSNMFHSGWFNDTKIPPLKDLDYDYALFTLKPLSDEPFDILKCIDTEGSVISAPVSDSTSINDHHEQPMDFTQQQQQQQQQQEQEQEQDIWISYTPPPSTFNTLSWDTQNRHFPSFAQSQLAKSNIGSAFLTEAPITLFEPVIQSRSLTPDKVIREAELVKSLIQAMVGLPSIYFYWQSDEFKMRVPHVRILGVSTIAALPVLKEILKFGTQLRAIENVAKTVKRNPNRYGLTGVAMACCLSELHSNMQQEVISIFEKEEKVTILKVRQYVDNLAVVTEKLYILCSICSTTTTTGEMTRTKQDHISRYGFYIPFGVGLINMLHEEIQKFDLAQSGNHALYRDICLSMLCYTSVPYLSMLSKWLGLDKDYNSGVVDDPYKEFFISTNVQIQDILERFQIRPDTTLPYFISPEIAIYIFRSGISLQLLGKTKPNHPIFDISDSIPLKCLLKNMESDEYMTKLDTICKYIQAYNSGTNIIEKQQQQQQPIVPDTPQEQQDEDDLIPRLTFLNPTINLKGNFLTTLTDLIQHDQQSNNFIPTLDTITYQSYTQPLQIWCPLLNESFMTCFLHQFKLQFHLSLLYNYFLFGNGTFVTGLKSTFFKSDISLSHTKSWPPKSYDLNMALRDLLLEEEDEDVFSFRIREFTESSAWLNPNAVEALDFLELNYHAMYPLNIVITPTILTNYNRIFTFLLQILRASTVTKRIFERLKSMRWFRSQTHKQISQYRFCMDQFMSAIQSYIHDSAIQDTWFRFMQHIKEMDLQQQQQQQQKSEYVSVIMEPHTFKEYHEHVLDRILYQCFLKQSQQRILNTLLPVLHCVILFGVVLDDYTELDLQTEDKLYFKCRKVFDLFQRHVRVFMDVLKRVEEKGYGRLSNLLNSRKYSVFNDLYARHEAKHGLDVFVKDLLVRLSLNGFYK